MATYQYDFPDGTEGWVMQIVSGKIYAGFGKDPTTFPEFMGLSGSQYSITVHFSRDLTVGEGAILDGVMAQANLGLSPATSGYTKTEIPDFLTSWKAIETDTGLKIDYAWRNPDTGRIELWTLGDITTAKRNTLRNKLLSLITITKY